MFGLLLTNDVVWGGVRFLSRGRWYKMRGVWVLSRGHWYKIRGVWFSSRGRKPTAIQRS